MSADLTWIGLDELKAALKNLPADLTELAEAIVTEAANGAAAEIRAAYPEGETGNLRRGVRVSAKTGGKLSSQFGVGRVVRSTAPHAWIFETGPQTRYNVSRNGVLLAKPAHRGFMPGANIFVPVAQRWRRDMYEDLTAVVDQAMSDVVR